MLFFRSQCPRCGAGTGINLEPGIVMEFLSSSGVVEQDGHLANVAGDGRIPSMERFTEVAESIQTTVGRQNLTHFVCGPNRDVCHYAWSMLN